MKSWMEANAHKRIRLLRLDNPCRPGDQQTIMDVILSQGEGRTVRDMRDILSIKEKSLLGYRGTPHAWIQTAMKIKLLELV